MEVALLTQAGTHCYKAYSHYARRRWGEVVRRRAASFTGRRHGRDTAVKSVNTDMVCADISYVSVDGNYTDHYSSGSSVVYSLHYRAVKFYD